jgi:Na+-driven multidrug efflux pump
MGAAAAVAGQNLGAKQPDRANAAVHVAASVGFGGALFLGILFLFYPRQLVMNTNRTIQGKVADINK